MEINLGTCPIIVTDEETAKQAGEWAQQMVARLMSNEAPK